MITNQQKKHLQSLLIRLDSLQDDVLAFWIKDPTEVTTMTNYTHHKNLYKEHLVWLEIDKILSSVDK